MVQKGAAGPDPSSAKARLAAGTGPRTPMDYPRGDLTAEPVAGCGIREWVICWTVTVTVIWSWCVSSGLRSGNGRSPGRQRTAFRDGRRWLGTLPPVSARSCLRRPGAGFLPRHGRHRAVPARDGLPRAGRLFRETADAGGFRMSTPAGFVGRQSELRILGERLAAAQTGQPQVVYVESEAGGGKSTLLSRFLGSPSVADAVVLQVSGDEAETLLSYGGHRSAAAGGLDGARDRPDGGWSSAAGPVRPVAIRR